MPPLDLTRHTTPSKRPLPPGWAVLGALMTVVAWAALSSPAEAMLALQRLTTQCPDPGWLELSWLGDTHLALALFVAAALLQHRQALPTLLWSVLPAVILTHSAKLLLNWPRPAAVLPLDQLHVIGDVLRHDSFPSGHTVTAFTLAGCWVLAAPPSRRWRAAAVALPLATAVGLSRVAVGAHWPLDVAAGALLGWTVAWAGHAAARRWGPRPAGRLLGLGQVTALLLGVTLFMRELPSIAQPLAYALGSATVAAALLTLTPGRRGPRSSSS